MKIISIPIKTKNLIHFKNKKRQINQLNTLKKIISKKRNKCFILKLQLLKIYAPICINSNKINKNNKQNYINGKKRMTKI